MKEKTKRCSKCGEVKAAANFAKDISRPDGLNAECRQCRRQRYQAAHGGVEHALRYFTDEELMGEVVRRDTAYQVLESIDLEDIVSYLRGLSNTALGSLVSKLQGEGSEE